jgi:hypothetical protein
MVKVVKDSEIRGWAALPKSGLILITGFRGTGKTALAWRLAEQGHDKGREIAAFDFTPAAKRALPSWVKHVATVRQVGGLRPSLLVVDEAALKVHARRHQSSENVAWTRLLAVARHKGHLVFLITQHQRQVDVGLVADAEMVIMKRPSQLHLRFARPELRQELEEAWEHFRKIRNPQRWSYVVDYLNGRKGWLTNGLPTFWSDELSRAFASVDLGGGAGRAVGSRRNGASAAVERRQRAK